MKIKLTTLLSIILVNLVYSQTPHFKWGYGFGSKSSDLMRDMVVDSKGNIITVGPFANSIDMDPSSGVKMLTAIDDASGTFSSQDIFITKYASNGKLIWAYSIGNNKTDDILQVKVDTSDNIYILGKFQSFIDFDPTSNVEQLNAASTTSNLFFAKYDSNFNYIWGHILENQTNTSSSIIPISLDIDKNGNVYIVGSFQYKVDFDTSPFSIFILQAKPLSASSTSSTTESFIAKYNKDGNFVWAKQIPTPTITATTFGNSYLKKIKFDLNNNVFYLAGYFLGYYDLDPSSNSDTLKSNSANGPTFDMFIAKYDTAGNYIWGNGIGGAGYEYLNDLDIDKVGNIYAIGQFNDIADFNPTNTGKDTLTSVKSSNGITYSLDMFCAKYDNNGNYVWANKFGGSNADNGNSISVSEDGNVYVTGFFAGKRLDFNSSKLPQDTAFISSKGTNTAVNDAFIGSYNTSSGKYNWAYAIGGTSSDNGYVTKAGKGTDVFFSGTTFSTNIYLNPNTTDTTASYVKPNTSGQDSYLSKFSTCTVNNSITIDGYKLTCAETSFGTTYQWINCDTEKPISGATSQSFTAKSNGNYAVIVTLNGCSETSICQNITGIGFQDLHKNSQINIFPNPANTTITLSVNGNLFKNEHVQIIILDILGNEIKSINGKMLKESNSQTIDVSELSNGAYFLKVNNSVKQFVKN